MTASVLAVNGWDTLLVRQTLNVLVPGAIFILVVGYSWVGLVLWIGLWLEVSDKRRVAGDNVKQERTWQSVTFWILKKLA